MVTGKWQSCLCLLVYNVRIPVCTLSSSIHRLLSVPVMSIFVCSNVLIVKFWLLMRLKVPSITASFGLVASSILVQFDILYVCLLSLDHHISKNTLCPILYHVLLINQTDIFGLRPMNSLKRWSLCSSFKIGPDNFLKLRNGCNIGNFLSTWCS